MTATVWMRRLAFAAWWLGVLCGGPGLLLRSALLLCIAATFLPLGFLLYDVSRAKVGGITAMTAYSAAAVATSFANTVAVLSANTPAESEYFLYVSVPHIYVAMTLAFAAAVIPPLAFQVAASSRLFGAVSGLLPTVRGEIGDRQMVSGGIILGLVAVVVHWQLPLTSLGALGSVFFLSPMFVTFVLARAGANRNLSSAYTGALVVAFAEAVRAFLFGYLRGDVAAPFIAFVLGALTGARSLRPMKSRAFLPVYIAAALFIAYFGAYGAIRGHTGAGLQRLEAVQQYHDELQGMPDLANQTVLSRLTTINQLSQIGRLVDEEGYLHGQTLAYLAYAFIPRFLWPQKPTIAKAAWFALHIGLAYVRPNGQITNAINMTIPGELYLNYGWEGVVVGLAFLGFFVAAFWRTTDFWARPSNVLGTAFAFYLMWPWIGFNLGGDMQILVTILAVYLVLVALGLMLPASQSRHVRRSGAIQVAHT
jgi:hypothetical protein